MIKLLLIIFLVMMVSFAAYAEEKPKLGQDDFISSTVSDVFDKLNQYTSGQAKIIDENWDKPEQEKARSKGKLEDDMSGVTIKPATTTTLGE